MVVLESLKGNFPRHGRIEWIGVRPRKHAAVIARLEVCAQVGAGLAGDHYGGASGARGITLMQSEHLAVMGALLGEPPLDPARLRRNLVVSGLNLAALQGRQFKVGEALLQGTGLCHPCARMEAILGPGGYNAMRGHGGLNARVLSGGLIRVGDVVAAC
ncbi:MOSC domain-containing protein [uncultured Thiodictyon sp.]|uniref:MOSC domain-containing protein n=1 Tax=uncultured Thiodictyon sp. TaxID=1846217 RepID=UPI0025D56E2F|nr:MOSC domain-containing protein [uncultured Thiodictyon sp.]